jgi:hypothetical protein
MNYAEIITLIIICLCFITGCSVLGGIPAFGGSLIFVAVLLSIVLLSDAFD